MFIYLSSVGTDEPIIGRNSTESLAHRNNKKSPIWHSFAQVMCIAVLLTDVLPDTLIRSGRMCKTQFLCQFIARLAAFAYY